MQLACPTRCRGKIACEKAAFVAAYGLRVHDEIEEKAFSIASYGKQLGLITEVAVDVAEQVGTEPT